jgi:pantoate--beta-alanine ligase
MSSPDSVTWTIPEIRSEVKAARDRGMTIGLVPTMGALHDGHVRLIQACRDEADFVVVSVFVNPTQFGVGEDFEKYPRTLEEDRLKSLGGGASVIFSPSVGEIYAGGLGGTYVEVPSLSGVFEGRSRPGHFRGVATVVLKLLNIVRPDVALFGLKDYQQYQVIRRMVSDLCVPVTIRGLATVREADGLAMSSRNRYLGSEDRRAAVILSRALSEAVEAVAGGEREGDRVRQILRQRIESEGRATLDYADVADAETLEPLDVLSSDRPAIALVAARVGPARLIDNALLASPGSRSDAHLAPEK